MASWLRLKSFRSVVVFSALIIPATLLLTSPNAWSLNPAAQKLVEWETTSNNISTRISDEFMVQHYEIPLRLLETNFAASMPVEIQKAMIFKKNGEAYVRWLINPDDTKWHLKVKKFLDKNGVSSVPQTYFKASRTASRSMIIEDPQTGYTFSLKVSTNNTGGNWVDKKLDYKDATDIRAMSDLFESVYDAKKMKNLVPLYEPFLVGIPSLDQGMLIRTLGDLGNPNGKRYYLPGFSALHEQTGVEIAKLNGSNNPAEFWDENYMKPMGQAMAQFANAMGAFYDSPHSQNFLIELDSHFKPTGRMVFRDFADTYIMQDFYKTIGRDDIIKSYKKEGNSLKDAIEVTFGPLHGNTPPTWVSKTEYKKWLETFFESFEGEFSNLSGVPAAELGKNKMALIPFGYGSKTLDLQTDAWQAFFASKKSVATAGGKPNGKVIDLAPYLNPKSSESAASCEKTFAVR